LYRELKVKTNLKNFTIMIGLDVTGLDSWSVVLLAVCIIAVLAFEFVNGFHDTANAVATVIYTKILKPQTAVIWSGLWNFIGVLFGGVTVAMGIVKLLPLNDMAAQPLYENIALVLGLLLAAITWNLATWYFGIPCSSSHTLIGSLLGVGVAFKYWHGGAGVNWEKAQDIGLSLLLSPFFGFTMAIILMFALRAIFKKKHIIFQEPKKKHQEKGELPFWVRALLVFTCTGVSYFHGNNDGQKGVGLMLVVLMAFMPAQFALQQGTDFTKISANIEKIEQNLMAAAAENPSREKELKAAIETCNGLQAELAKPVPTDGKGKFAIRKRFQSFSKAMKVFTEDEALIPNKSNRSEIKHELKPFTDAVEYAPYWTVIAISLALGLGTMIGWKRIVVTIGEKIGKSHMSYAQGATAELIAMTTIGLSSGLGLPVSTTHVLSSGVAGGMVASDGVQNLQKKTIMTIALAWVLTLPVTMLLSIFFYFVARTMLGVS
jgi:inorganic phosphate transporter, PiT family